ncbi:sugar O-acetyltransferase [Muribaculum intestinale]|uniref:sugar O-acetyltransferase n=1 Tax=Muribaculum intestinale TaxID=1796646 RepID=UPI0027295375|nr:sugar O-acetyltransferase [Muribaculum intestinale]
MTEKEKMLQGMIYDANNDAALITERLECKELIRDYNDLRPKDVEARDALLRRILGDVKGDILIEQPFYCDYGFNISVGKNFFANFNMVVLDEARVVFGDNVFIGPNCGFYTAGHPIDSIERNKGLEFARPIIVGNNVWIGANVTVVPGVTIGDNCVIGAGSVVTKDIPDNTVAVGNPCKVIKSIDK